MKLKNLVNRGKYYTFYILCLAILVLLITVQGCIPRLVPIQTARINQMEFYRQIYAFENAQHAKSVLTKLLGKKNWQTLEDHYAFGDITDDLLNQEIEVQGAFTISISLVPTDLDSFYIDGIGRYFLVRKTTNELILTGDYYIKNRRYAIKDMMSGVMRVDIKQFTLRHFAPNETNYYQDVSIDFNMHMKTISAEKKIYSLDYDARHEVLFENKIIGYLEFDEKTPRYDKLIDLRGLNLVKNDYAKILKESKRGSPEYTNR